MPSQNNGDVFTIRPNSIRSNSVATPVPRMFVWGCGGNSGYSFQDMRRGIAHSLRRQTPINRGTWQTLDVKDSPAHATLELRNVQLFYTPPETHGELMDEVEPDMPWAGLHFMERVSRDPVNPPPSHLLWPHGTNGNVLHLNEEKFSHTYPERYWPRFANIGETRPNGRQVFVPHNGIRYEYGDLDGVVDQLVQNPLTRQAVLPVFFPEDTGATDRRVPCTLTYHFMADENYRLSVWYSMRACDFVRHFHNDVYFAARLLEWVSWNASERCLTTFHTGEVNMSISSLHAFVGDVDRMP